MACQDLGPLASLSGLRELSLGGSSQIRDVTPLWELGKLKYLTLWELKGLTYEQVAQLRNRLPRCRIEVIPPPWWW